MTRLVEIRARTLLRRSKVLDSWFLSRWGMNLYRGCQHACAYCDGRSERYRVEGDFGAQVQVKVNAPELLAREVPRLREPGFLFIGGGVCDAYQPAEARHRLARAALEQALAAGHSVHVLTKSTLARRDLDLLGQIAGRAAAILSVSLSTLDPDLSAMVEPGCPPPAERLELLRQARAAGLATGIMLMPLLPLLSDGEQQIEQAMAAGRDAGVR